MLIAATYDGNNSDFMRLNVTATHNIEPRNKDYKRDKQKSICEYFPIALSGILVILLISVLLLRLMLQTWLRRSGSDISLGSFVGVKTITIEYPAGSPSAQEARWQESAHRVFA